MDKIYVNIFKTYNDNLLYEFTNMESAKKFIKRNFAKEMEYLTGKGEKIITSYCNGNHAEIRLDDEESFASWDISAPQKLRRYMVPVIVEAETLEEALKYLQSVVKDDEINFDEARLEDEGFFSGSSKCEKATPITSTPGAIPSLLKDPKKSQEINKENTFLTSKTKEIEEARKKLEKDFNKINEETKIKLDSLGKDNEKAKKFEDLEERVKKQSKTVDKEQTDFYTAFLKRR